MKSQTYRELTRAARVAGYQSLGAWLDSGKVTAGAGPGESRSPGRTADVCTTVRGLCAQATDALSSIREVLDNEHKEMAANPEALRALKTLREEYRRFLELLRAVGLEKMNIIDPNLANTLDYARRSLERIYRVQGGVL